MPVSRVECPGCQSVLTSTKPIPAGKKIKCSKCGEVFSTPQEESGDSYGFQDQSPAAKAVSGKQRDAEDEPPAKSRLKPARRKVVEDEEDEEDEGFEREIEDNEEEDRSRPSRRPKRRRAKNSLALVVALMIGGSLFFVAAAGGIGAFWYFNRDKNRGTGREDPLAYIPANSNAIFGINVGLLMEQPALAGVIEEAAKSNVEGTFLEQVKKEAGLDFKDLFDHAIYSVRTDPEDPSARVSTVVCQSRVPFNQNRMRDSAKEPKAQRVGGKTYFQVKEKDFHLMYMPSNSMVVMTNMPENELEALISSGGTQAVLTPPVLEMILPVQSEHLWMVVPIGAEVRSGFQKGLEAGPGAAGLPPQFQILAGPLSGAQALGIWGTADGNTTRLRAGVTCASQSDAEQLAGSIKSVWDSQVKGLGAQMLLGSIPESQRGLIKEAMENTNFSSRGTMALASSQAGTQNLVAMLKDLQRQANQQQFGAYQRRFRPGAGP